MRRHKTFEPVFRVDHIIVGGNQWFLLIGELCDIGKVLGVWSKVWCVPYLQASPLQAPEAAVAMRGYPDRRLAKESGVPGERFRPRSMDAGVHCCQARAMGCQADGYRTVAGHCGPVTQSLKFSHETLARNRYQRSASRRWSDNFFQGSNLATVIGA